MNDSVIKLTNKKILLQRLETRSGPNSLIYRIGNYDELHLIESKIVDAIRQVAFEGMRTLFFTHYLRASLAAK